MLIWKNVTFSYENSGKPILNNVNLEVDSSKITVITGASGCGKSTLLFLACGLYPKNAGILQNGEILLNGENIFTMPHNERALKIGMVFQNPHTQFCMDTLKSEMVFCLENIQMQAEKIDCVIDEALEFCSISHLKNRALVTLSGGEKQLAMLACITALCPKHLLLDEPFANLDIYTSKLIISKLKDLNNTFGMGITVVDHQIQLWESVAHEYIILSGDGSIKSRSTSLPFRINYESKLPQNNLSNKIVLSMQAVSVYNENIPTIKNCSANFYCGKTHAIIGKSGSGKSTLFNALLGILDYNGSITVLGKELSKIKRTKRGEVMGLVFQNPQDQFIASRVLDEIKCSFPKTVANKEKLCEEILREINLWKYRYVSPYMLSQGQQRRLGIAAMLACNCKILVCDEPTYAQDYECIVSIMNSLQNQVIFNNLTLIFSTHDVALAKAYANYIYEIKEGKLFEISASCL